MMNSIYQGFLYILLSGNGFNYLPEMINSGQKKSLAISYLAGTFILF